MRHAFKEMRVGAIAAVMSLLLIAGPRTGHCAQDEQNRRFAVELAVLAGDVRLLRQSGLPETHRRGLSDRVASALGFIGLLGREALQASKRHDPELSEEIARLRLCFAAGDLAGSAVILGRLVKRFPLDTRSFLPVTTIPARLARGRELYESTCRACHIAPDTRRRNPARDLFQDARTMPAREFLARLIGGVRGVPQTGLENPLSDEDLRALLAWFMHGRDKPSSG
ncbi:cytochrome c [Thiorhodococcus mannitoliphagus]|uniref:Cytochrome c n=1 Tax=Thiorhodococcus mannitoliphagus TaxID=329406 RepID=A0A6P1DZK1_9GAMM|nr:cytochrome c [Thiorhodococcus mannitoliphagus]NEX22451.1 cytochrome c [Thiorhodococcus mannitoliphagus]